MIVYVISDGYPKLVRNPMDMGMNINFYPRVRSWADIDSNHGYGCGRIFAISDPLPSLGEHRVRYHTEDESGNVDHRYPRPGDA
jgi:hypothetical protein